MISNEVISIIINVYLIRLMSPSFLVKMFQLHIEDFYPYKGILSIGPCWSLSDPERPARMYTENALIRVKEFYVL